MPELPTHRFYLGADLDAAGNRTNTLTTLDPADLVTHGVIVGMTGSGKTGLGVVLLEEALLAGIPCLVIDPKGDLTNLALTFPDLAPQDFAPWVDPSEVIRQGLTTDELARHTATQWRDGLAQWGIDGSRIRRLRDTTAVTIYTPGSTAGVPLNLIGGLTAPPPGVDLEDVEDEILGFVSGLLAMAGVEADPLASREHILLTNLIADAWSRGRDLDLASLLGLVQDPPMRKLGVLDLNSFYPTAERRKLVVRLNGMLASPSFGAWSCGAALDVGAMLAPTGRRAPAAVVCISHLTEDERQFVVALQLSKVVAWMRSQRGTSSLRALVYMDEVTGYVPPTAMPPAKRPILTILKQARAFGVGLVLATQNPADIDYKALSNAGTWMIGRLQTERDKSRLLDGLTSATSQVDVGAVSATISSLDKRQFLLQRSGATGPVLFTTRWAMSYLRGPLDRPQIASLSPHAAATTGDPNRAEDLIAEDEIPLPPPVAEGTPVAFLDAAAPWAGAVGADPSGRRWSPSLVARVRLSFSDRRANASAEEEWEAVLFPLEATLDWSAATLVDHDDRDLRDTAPPGARFALPAVDLASKRFYREARTRLVAHLRRTEHLSLAVNRELKVMQRSGESTDSFTSRVDAAADAAADEEANRLRDALTGRGDKIRRAIDDARARVEDLEAERAARRTGGLLEAAGGVVGALLGGRRSSRSIARSLGKAAGSATSDSSAPLRAAQRRMERGETDLAAIEAKLAEDLRALDLRWGEVATRIDRLEITLSAQDVHIDRLAVCWLPTAT